MGRRSLRRISLQRPPETSPRSNKLLAGQPPPDAKDMRRLDLWIQLHVISRPMPEITRIAQEVVHLINIRFHRAKIFQRDVNIRMLDALWIQIHHDQDDVVPRRGHFSVTENGVILSPVEAQVIVEMQRAILLPNAV